MPVRKWAVAIYLEITSRQGVSSLTLHRGIGVSQPTAWFGPHRICEVWKRSESSGHFCGPVEVAETC